MGTGMAVWNAVKVVASWVALNPDVVKDTVKLLKPKTEDKVNQLGAAVVELDQKLTSEMETLRKELRTTKIMLAVMGSVLGLAVIAIILLAIL